jgi:hypothetical protein
MICALDLDCLGDPALVQAIAACATRSIADLRHHPPVARIDSTISANPDMTMSRA